jgi:DNA-directed RNA polymerase subunit A'
MQAEIINNIKFGIFSQDQIKKLSVAKLTVPDTYNEDGYPIDGGLLDQRLGVIDPGLICKTCGGRAKTCPGHFGHIELVRPVIHSEFAKIINMLLQATCQSCHRILLNNEEIAIFKDELTKELASDMPVNETDKQQGEQDMMKKLKSVKKCPHCGNIQEKMKFSMPTYFYYGERRLKPDEIRDLLSKIPNDDLAVMGVDPKTSRPEALVLNTLLVPPVDVRPSITLETGERSEDDLTHKLVDIMRINQRLEQNINAGAPQIIIDDLWELLQYHITTYFNNETSGIPPARHRSGRALKTIAQRLKGKEGRFRYNLSGKRVNYSARTVISVDPNIDLDEVGVPRQIAEKLTVPFYVTEWNLDEAKRLLGMTEYPQVINIVSPDGKRKRMLEANREEMVKEVKAGYILERQLRDGDISLFNRQPSLHRISIMAHRVRVLPGKTFRVTYAATVPYNADFDGDEMNLHIPQTLEAQAEAKYLMEAKEQIFSPRDGNAIMTIGEDGVIGLYLLTQEDTFLDKEEAEYILGIGGVRKLPKEAKKGMYRGRDIFSMMLPKGLNFETMVGKDPFKIKNGELIEGVVTKKVYGSSNKLYVAIAMQFGFDVLERFITNSSKLAFAYATTFGVTMGVKDYMISDEIRKEKAKLLSETQSKVDVLVSEYKTKKLEPLLGLTARQSLEQLLVVELDLARSKASQILIKNVDKHNFAMIMANSGARASILNFEQMSLFLGQQATWEGRRIKRGYYSNRAIPHIARGDVGPAARGFISNCFLDGLSPIEMLMHAVGARGSVIQKGLLTQRSGYLQRRLANAMQDYYISSDSTVRDTSNNLVQTIYGGDGIDPTKVNFVKEEERLLKEKG